MPPAAVILLQAIFPDHRRVFASADPLQFVDRYRGRTSGAVAEFQRLCDPRTIHLDRNFRARGALVAAVSQICDDDPPRCPPAADENDHLTLDVAPDMASEARLVAQRVLALHRKEVAFADQVILAWSHASLTDIAAALSEEDIPVKFIGDLKCRPEVCDAKAFLCSEAAKGSPSVSVALIDWLFSRDGYLAPLLRAPESAETRMKLLALHHVVRICEQHEAMADGGDLNALVRRIDVAASLDQRTHYREIAPDVVDVDAVSLLTIRAARGKTFKTVHVAGLYQKRSSGAGHGTEDEKAILRVAVSRAEERLHLSWPARVGRCSVQGLPGLDRIAELVRTSRRPAPAGEP